ncbi:MAG: S46 family peptidase [Bacteroidales bacterium]|nr:S46 family peptidase [Bacteroidales bacterium]
MKKFFLLSLFALLIAQVGATNPPDEGMWLPMFVKDYNYATMQKLGLKLSAEQMYNINNSSLKDAIVELGNDGQHFCTGEIISEQGLMLTNHHCGYAAIADHSTTEHDYLKDGFWAKTFTDELPNPGLTATFLVRMEDVTKKVLEGVTEETKKSERTNMVQKAIKELTTAAEENGRYTVAIKDFFDGNEYYMFVYEVYRDVRLVGAPPSSIGKFGDETDNWVWPRHTGDFSMFRIYTAPDGSPAEYSENNIPMKPKYSLPVSTKGIEYGDYAMIWGIPGSTDRYMTSYEVEKLLKCQNTPIIEACDVILPEIREEMNARDEVRIAYASDYASMANTWKNQKGEYASLTKLGIAAKKAEQEKVLLNWINADSKRQELYGNPLEKIQSVCASADQNVFRAFFYCNFSLMLSKTTFVAYNIDGWRLRNGKTSFTPEEQAKALAEYKEYMKGTDAITEAKIIAAELRLWKQLPEEYRIDIYNLIDKKYKGNCEAFAKACVEKSIMGNADNFAKYLAKPSEKALENDPLYNYFQSLLKVIIQHQGSYMEINNKLETPRRKYMAALKAMTQDPMYPDANSTMRCTFGTVCDYYPSDGVKYLHYTTAEGILQKEIPGDPEFDVHPKLKQLILNKDFGQYAMKDGKLPVCFLTNNDITGGNSGSPVLNGKGELIGCAFDGNIEALCSDIFFDTELQRCICVDIRYVLFVIDKFAGATRFIDEMKLVK